MVDSFFVTNIVMEASTKEDKSYMRRMSKDDVNQINGQAVQTLYDLSIEKSHIDFGEIPASAGDFEKCKYYDNTKKCIEVMLELHSKSGIKDDDLVVIKTAMSNMLRFRSQFTMGFKMKHNFVMLMYNSLAMAIIDATATCIRSYTDYIITADPNYKVNVTFDNRRGCVALDNLKLFNQACDNGSINQALTYMINSGKKALIGEEAIITAVVVTCLLSIVPIIREIIYFYYHSRVKISDYLKMEADFLEMNSHAVSSASGKSPSERKAIAKKQEKLVADMRKLSDKISIDHVDTNDVVKKEINDEKSLFSLDNIDKQLNKNKMQGTDITFI